MPSMKFGSALPPLAPCRHHPRPMFPPTPQPSPPARKTRPPAAPHEGQRVARVQVCEKLVLRLALISSVLVEEGGCLEEALGRLQAVGLQRVHVHHRRRGQRHVGGGRRARPRRRAARQREALRRRGEAVRGAGAGQAREQSDGGLVGAGCAMPGGELAVQCAIAAPRPGCPPAGLGPRVLRRGAHHQGREQGHQEAHLPSAAAQGGAIGGYIRGVAADPTATPWQRDWLKLVPVGIWGQPRQGDASKRRCRPSRSGPAFRTQAGPSAGGVDWRVEEQGRRRCAPAAGRAQSERALRLAWAPRPVPGCT